MRLPLRLALAVVAGLAAGVICYDALQARGELAADYTWVWRGAREVLSGRNPYHDPRLDPANPYPWNAPLYYPLPAVLLVAPLAWLPAHLSAAVFTALSVGLLAFAASREGWPHWLILLSPSCYRAATEGHWAPLVVALALLPGLAPLTAALKPNLGAAVGLTRWSWRGVGITAAIGSASLLALPSWPLDWLHNLGAHRHSIPLLVSPAALVLLLAALAWRERAARLLLLMALVPQRLIWSDQLPLHLVPATLPQQLTLLATSWVGYLVWRVGLHEIHSVRTFDDVSGPLVLLSVYLPALAVVLWQQRAALRAALPRRYSPPTGTDSMPSSK